MFNSIISVVEKHGFLRKMVFPKMKIEQMKFGPTGYLLLQNLKNEWFYNIVINKDVPVFLSDNDSFNDTLEFAKDICLERLPFGVAEVIQNKKVSSTDELISYYTERMKEEKINFEKLFANEDRVLLRCTIFASSNESVQLFHQWQRQRRIWWRKFSPQPGRYTLTDIKTDEKSHMQSVQIMAKYPWNLQLVETLKLYQTSRVFGEIKFKEGKKTIYPHSIVSEIDLTTMFINAICDAYDEPEYKGFKRTLLRFHRKIAPYRISFAIAGSGAAVTELNDLALYLTKQLRTNHVSTLFLPSSSKLTLEAQWKQYDELGIPYNVLLNEGTLRDGIASLRSRDTTLKEQVHVTDLVSYVEQLFKNY